MKNLPMDLLRAFIAVSQLESFTKAGEMLGRSQPAVTLKVKRLEKLLGEELFFRRGRTLKLTNPGIVLYDYAEQILSLNDTAISRFSKSAITGNIRLGIPSEFATILLPKILGRFAKAYPSITIEVNCELSRQLLTQSGRSKYDVILALGGSSGDPDTSLIKSDELVWVTESQQDHNFEEAIPLIVAPEGCIYRDTAIRALNKAKLPWHIAYTNPDLTGIQYAIKEGLGVTVLAKSTVPENLNMLTTTEVFPNLGKIDINIIFSHKSKDNEAVGLLCEFITTSLT